MVSGSSVMVTSKWGAFGLYSHEDSYCSYFSTYPNTYWKQLYKGNMDMLRKPFLFLMCMAVPSFGMYGCHKEEPEKKTENTTTIVIGYDINSHIAIITDKDQIKQLEELFNRGGLTKSGKEIQPSYI